MITIGDNDIASILTTISAVSSIAGGLFILRTYKDPHYTSSARKLLAFLTIADIATAFGNLIGAARFFFYQNSKNLNIDSFPNDGLCVSQSFVTTMSSLCSFSWTFVIAIHLSLAIQHRIDITNDKRLMCLVHGLSWGIPAIITTAAVCANKLGEDMNLGSGPWCWIKQTHLKHTTRESMWMLFTGKLWEILTFILSFLLYAHIKVRIWKQRRRLRLNGFSNIMLSLRDGDELFCYAWLVFSVLRMWGTVRFFMIVIPDVKPASWQNAFLYMQCIGDSGQAFGNFLLYCVVDSIQRRCRKKDVIELE